MNTLVVVALLHGVQLHQADFERVTLQRATSAVTIDGRLADAAWEAASPISLPFEVRPRSNVAARVRTECRATFDDHALYFGCEASDDPRNIRAYLTDRDRIGHHDRIVLFIDPFADARRAFFFNVNPLGVQQDGIFNGLDGSADLAWDAVWESAGRVTDSGYTVEMAIPFGSIRFPTGAREHIWRFFVERNWPRSENVVLRSTRLDQSNACNLCQSDELAGLVNVVPGLGIQINPTLTFARTDRRNQFPTGNVVSGPVDAELGLSGRVRVHRIYDSAARSTRISVR